MINNVIQVKPTTLTNALMYLCGFGAHSLFTNIVRTIPCTIKNVFIVLRFLFVIDLSSPSELKVSVIKTSSVLLCVHNERLELCINSTLRCPVDSQHLVHLLRYPLNDNCILLSTLRAPTKDVLSAYANQ